MVTEKDSDLRLTISSMPFKQASPLLAETAMMMPDENVERLRKRRAYESRRHMIEAGATGLPSKLPPLEAIRAGECPMCSFPTNALHKHLVVHFPGMSYTEARKAFLVKLDLPEDTDLTSDAKREIQRAAQLKRMNGPEAEKIRKSLAEKARGNSSHLADVRNWPIVREVTRGRTAEQAWKKIDLGDKLTPHSVGVRARDMGYSYATPARSDQSEPYTYERLFRLRRTTAFEVSDFDRCVGLDEWRSGATVPGERIMDPEEAGAAIAWRDRVLTALLNVEPTLKFAGKEYRKDDLLLTFVPEIVGTYNALIRSIGEVRDELRKSSEWTLEDFCEALCRAAAREQSIEGNQDDSRRKTLRYLAEEKSEEWLAANYARLRGGERDGPLVRELIGSRYGVTGATVQNALRSRTDVIAPIEVRMLIKEYAPGFATAKKTPGPKLKPESKKESWRVSARVNEQIPALKRLLEALEKFPAGVRSNSQAARKRLGKEGFSEDQIAAVFDPTFTANPVTAARRSISNSETIQYDTVAKYHRDFPLAGLSSDT